MTPPATLTIDQLLEERQWLSRLCGQLVRDSSEADDLVQESMLRALGTSSAASAHADGKLRGWLTTTARRVAMESRRRSGRRVGREIEAAQPEQVLRTPASALAHAELREQLARLVMQLPKDEREVVVLRYYEGLRPKEIAEQLEGVSTGAVRQRLYRGMARLRDMLDADTEGGRRKWLSAAVALASKTTSTVQPVAATSTGATFGWILPTVIALPLLASLAWFLNGALALRGSGPPAAHPTVAAVAPLEVSKAEALPLIEVEEVREPIVPTVGDVAVKRTFKIVHPQSNDPIAGAEWYAIATGERDPEPYGAMDPEYLPPSARLAEGLADANGLAEVPPIEADLYQLIVCRGQDYAAGSFAIDPRSSTPGPTELVPPLGSGVQGRFVNSAGEPLAGAEMMEYDLQEEERIVGTSDANGHFQILGMSQVPRQLMRRDDGSVVHTWAHSSGYYVRAKPADPWVHIPIWRGPDAVSRDAKTGMPPGHMSVLGDVVVAQPMRLRSFVVDEEGQPVTGARIGYGRAHENFLWAAHRGTDPVDHPWGNSASNQIVLSDETGAFDLPVFRPHSSAFTRPEIVAIAPDGRRGTFLLPAKDPIPSSDLEKIVVTGKDSVQLILEDRLRPGEPIELPKGAARIAAWRRLETIRGTALERPNTLPAEVLSGGVVSIPRTGFRRGRAQSTIELEVPGYEVAVVEISVDGNGIHVPLDRRPRRTLNLRFPDSNVLKEGSVNVVLMSHAPDVKKDLSIARRFKAAWPTTSYAGGLALGLKASGAAQLAWPANKPAWLVAYSHPPGTYATPRPTVLGPLLALDDGATLDIPIEPWVLNSRWGPRDLSKGTEVPLY